MMCFLLAIIFYLFRQVSAIHNAYTCSNSSVKISEYSHSVDLEKGQTTYGSMVYITGTDFEAFSRWQQEDPNINLIEEDFSISRQLCYNHDTYYPHCRTKLLAHLRNSLLDAVRNDVEINNYRTEETIMISMDMDSQNHGVELNLFNRTLLAQVLMQQDQWDQVSFNLEDYYDIWGLRYDRFNFNLWGSDSGTLKIHDSDYYPVYSAWNGLALYKLNFTDGCVYNATCTDSAHCSESGENEICPFHQCMIDRNGAKIMINRNFLITEAPLESIGPTPEPYDRLIGNGLTSLDFQSLSESLGVTLEELRGQFFAGDYVLFTGNLLQDKFVSDLVCRYIVSDSAVVVLDGDVNNEEEQQASDSLLAKKKKRSKGGSFIDVTDTYIWSQDKSNTLSLEMSSKWNGIIVSANESVSINEMRASHIVVTNKFITHRWWQIFCDSFANGYFEENLVDYVSFDIHDISSFTAITSVVETFPFHLLKAKVITVRNSRHSVDSKEDMLGLEFLSQMRNRQMRVRRLLISKGYELVASNVRRLGDDALLSVGDDWFVNPEFVDMNSAWQFRLESFSFFDLFVFAHLGKLPSSPPITIDPLFFGNEANQQFIGIVKELHSNLTSFNLFRNDQRYLKYLHQVSIEEGLHIINYIASSDASFISLSEMTNPNSFINKVFLGNSIGNPSLTTYHIQEIDDYYLVLPVHTLQHIKVVFDIESLFRLKNKVSVAEIGVEFGGQAQVLFSRNLVSDYFLFDNEDVLRLSNRYLLNFDYIPISSVHFRMIVNHDVRSLQQLFYIYNASYDLCISGTNGLTRMSTDLQDLYLNFVLSKCEKGYIVYSVYDNSYSHADIIKKLNNIGRKWVTLMPNTPSKRNSDVIIVWGVNENRSNLFTRYV